MLRCNHQKKLLTVYITNNNLFPEAICCCLQTCNVVASEVMVGDASLIGINTTINQLKTNVYTTININCLRLFVVVYKHVIL